MSDMYFLTEQDVAFLRNLQRTHRTGENMPRPRYRRQPLPWRYPSESLKRFELTQNLALGSEANARLLEWDDSASEYVMVGETIVVKDFTENPGSWIAGEGFQGWCILPADADDGKYEIVWMENIARFIEFTLTANMSSGSATATVNEWWDIKQPIASPVTINDPRNLFRRALSGAKGIAVYDPKRDTYIAIECETKAGWIAGTSTEAMGGTTAAQMNVTVNRYSGSQQDIQDPGSSVVVHDPQGIYPRALEGAKCKAVYDAEADEYVLVECQQMVQRLSGTIPSINSGRGLLFADSYFAATVSGLEAITWSPFNQMPATSTIDIYNPHAWSAAVGAYFKAEWHEAKTRWELYQITARCEDPPEE
jgi:hypothetical protein